MYSKEEIIEFFTSVVNPALREFGAILKERDQEIDLQTHDPYFEFNGLDNTIWREVQPIDKKIWSKIDAFKPDAGNPNKIFSYRILAEPTKTNQNSCLLSVLIIWKNELNNGQCDETYAPDNISADTKDEFLQRVKMAYDNYRRMV